MKFSEDELISGIKNRNQKFYEILITEYTKPIYYLAYNILKSTCSKEDIEECVSDVLLEVWIKIKDYDNSRSSFKTWVFMLTKYKALKFRLKNAKNKVVSIDEQFLDIGAYESTEKTVIEREKQKQIINIIDSFNDVDKELFIRRYFYGEQISVLMDSLSLSRSAIDNRLLRGRKLIKEVLSSE